MAPMTCLTPQCKNWAVPEDEHDWASGYCESCEDRLIMEATNIREWDFYHPDEPCPKVEREKIR